VDDLSEVVEDVFEGVRDLSEGEGDLCEVAPQRTFFTHNFLVQTKLIVEMIQVDPLGVMGV